MVFDHMASRERNQRETKVDRLLKLLEAANYRPSRGDLIALFKDLVDISCGQFVAGRHGWPSRFIWDVDTLSVSRYVVGETPEVGAIQSLKENFIERDLIKHAFNLRTDLQICFELPVDLTEKEAERLAGFLKTLPMDEYD